MAQKKGLLLVLMLPALVLPAAAATTLSGGTNHSLQLVVATGTVRAWGFNPFGQLGDGTFYPHAIEEDVPGLGSSFTDVAACGGHSLALKNDGTVWAWGVNNLGQLGDTTTILRTSPVQVATLSGITAIACGQNHSLALKSNGTLWAWGFNGNGQLGDGTTANSSTPVQVSILTGLTTVIAIGAGQNHSLAVKTDGTAWAWGLNGNGQIGSGSPATQVPVMSPVQVSLLTSVTAVAGGGTHSLALKSDGTVWAWGNNGSGQLGIGNFNQQVSPVQVAGLIGSTMTMIDAGDLFSIALKSDGTVRTWGINANGQLGDGTLTTRNAPVQVTGLTNVNAIAAGSNHALAFVNLVGVVAWGFSGNGALGDGEFAVETSPDKVPGLSGVFTAIAAGGGHTIVRKNDGTAWAWGNNGQGQLGITFNDFAHVPTQVSGLTLVQDVAAGGAHSLALKSDGTVWAFGQNTFGQLGNNLAPTNSNVPVQAGSGTLTNVSSICGGNSHSMALKGDGTVWAWGNNSNGQLGIGSIAQQNVPVQVPGLAAISAIACGGAFSLALQSDGQVWVWGANNNGQLGDGTTTEQHSPVHVPGVTGVTAISASSGSGHALVLKNDGTVWGWGFNGFGQLGTGSATPSSTPVQAIGLAGVISIAAGTNHSLAVTSDGVVWAWGSNILGQLGNVSLVESDRPTRTLFFFPPNPIIAAKVSAAFHSVVLLTDGTVMTWGYNNTGQLGRQIGNFFKTSTVTPVIPSTPDLSVSMTHSGHFIVGQQGVYTITVTNLGTSAYAGPVALDDVLPAGMTYVSATGAGWACQPLTGYVMCLHAGSFAPATPSVITLTVKVGPAAFPSATNAAGIEGSDVNPLNDNASDPTVIAPLPRGVSPGSGSGLTRAFTFTFDAAGGWQSIPLVDVLINDALTGVSACYVAVIPSGQSSGDVYLVNNAGAAGGPYVSMHLPGAGSVSNSQCTISAAGSSVSGFGNTLTLTLAITFSAPFAGDKIVYTAVQDSTPVNSGWHAMGTWNVPGAAPVGPAVSPPTPARSTSSNQTFTFTFTDTLGFADIAITNVLINDALTGVAACYVAFVPSGSTAGNVYLVGNAGSAAGPFSALSLPGGGNAFNSQCTINGAGSSVSGSGNTLTLTLNITFSPSFAGDRIIYAATRTVGLLTSGWRAIGSASVP